LHDIFGADAAMYIIINSFGPSYQLLRSVVQVSASASLVDLRTSHVIWTGRIQREQGRNDAIHVSGGNFFQDILIMAGQAAIDQVINVIIDPSERLATEAIREAFSASEHQSRGRIPLGPHHPGF